MKTFLLLEDQGEYIGIVHDQKTMHDFYFTVKKAIAKYCGAKIENVTLLTTVTHKQFNEKVFQHEFRAKIILSDKSCRISDFFLSEQEVFELTDDPAITFVE